MATRIYVVLQQHLTYRKTKGGKLNCYVCDVPIKIGDLVVAKQTFAGKRPIRHEECARKIGMID